MACINCSKLATYKARSKGTTIYPMDTIQNVESGGVTSVTINIYVCAGEQTLNY